MIEVKLLLTEAEQRELEQALATRAVHLQRVREADASQCHADSARALHAVTEKYLAQVA